MPLSEDQMTLLMSAIVAGCLIGYGVSYADPKALAKTVKPIVDALIKEYK